MLATIIVQSLVFLAFVWFCMKFVWPPIQQAMSEREQRISDGLAASDRAAQELANAKLASNDAVKEAREQAADIIAQANRRSTGMIEEAKVQAREEGERQLSAARAEIEQEVVRAREALRGQVSALAVAGAGRILGRELDSASNDALLDDLVKQL